MLRLVYLAKSLVAAKGGARPLASTGQIIRQDDNLGCRGLIDIQIRKAYLTSNRSAVGRRKSYYAHRSETESLQHRIYRAPVPDDAAVLTALLDALSARCKLATLLRGQAA
jgi:hypothetical protein